MPLKEMMYVSFHPYKLIIGNHFEGTLELHLEILVVILNLFLK